ncbi:hypothetical protein [Bacteroides sp.]|uniref:hypothetical protein n=1 Tax=Bacteroides sp. TaxID=29523 RepID=UPI00260FF9A5|nr:hypothetical protein [Bacteroides sp.]MDD3039079.1 hypothetical protein [Bacteroides sp.]
MNPTILYASAWSKGSDIDRSFRYVLLKWNHKNEYSTHIEIKNPSTPHFISGNYFTSSTEASAHLKLRISRNNNDFLETNSSHIPGGITSIAFVCPECSYPQYCPCDSCKPRLPSTMRPWIYDPNHNSIIHCSNCGFSAHEDEWLDIEMKNAELISETIREKSDLHK